MLLLILAFVLFMAAALAVVGALAKDERSDGLARALRALEMQGSSAEELAKDADESFADRILDPLQDRALSVGRRITGADQAEQIRRRLEVAGNPSGWTVDRVVSTKVIAAIVTPVVLLAYGSAANLSAAWMIALVVGGAALGFFAPDLYLYNVGVKRADQLRKGLADAVDLLTISVESGLGFDAAVQQVARNTDGPIAEEFSRVLREMQLGMGRADAMRAMSDRSNVDDLRSFAGAMVQADQLGISIGQVLRVQSSEIRVKRRQYAEEKAQKVPVKIMIPLILFILPCLFVVVLGPAALQALDNFNGQG